MTRYSVFILVSHIRRGHAFAGNRVVVGGLWLANLRLGVPLTMTRRGYLSVPGPGLLGEEDSCQ